MEEAKLTKSAMDKENKEWFPVWAQIECLRTGLLHCRCSFGIGIDFPWSCFSPGQFELVFFWGYLCNVSEWFPWATPERSSRTEKNCPLLRWAFEVLSHVLGVSASIVFPGTLCRPRSVSHLCPRSPFSLNQGSGVLFRWNTLPSRLMVGVIPISQGSAQTSLL